LKILLGLVGLPPLSSLIVVAVIAIPMYFDPNDYRDEIAALAKKQTGRDLQIEGDLRVSVFPWLGVESGRVVLGNAAGFGDVPFFQAEEIQARVKLLPLLRREVEMDTVVIDRMHANLMRNKEGVTNWDDLIKARAPAEPADDDVPAIAALALGGLDIRDSRISWQDAETGAEYVIERLNLRTGKLEPGKPIDLELSMGVDISEPKTAGRLALNGTLAYDLERQYYRFTPFEFEADLQGDQFPGGKAKVAMTAAVEADLGANTASLKNLSLKTLGTRVDGDLDITHLDRDLPSVNGALEISGDDLPGLLRAIGQGERADQIKRRESSKFALQATISADAQAGTAKLSPFSGQILGVALQGDLSATGTQTDNPAISGQLKIAGDELSDLLAVAGQPQMADTLKALNADMTLSGTRKSLKLEPIQARATFAGDALPEGPVDVDLVATATADLDKETLVMPSLSVKGMGLDVQGSLNAAGIMTEPQFSGELKMAPFNLRRLMQQTGNEVR
jgi:AsmA protein